MVQPAAAPAPDAMARWDLGQWLAYGETLHARAIALGLERVVALRDALGLRFDVPVFTVGGTNGKGSTCAFIEAVLLAAGYRVGVYSSPHLLRFEERCRIQGEAVDAAALLPHLLAVELARRDAGLDLTYFEFTTLAILRLLAASGLDAVVLEVGMGGRLDAVNAIDPDCAVITSIALDHMEFLGPDREAIGREKAGILRAGRPAIVAEPDPPASLLAHAAAIGADLRRLGRDFGFSPIGQQQWTWHGRDHRRGGLAWPAMRGVNQLRNASAALAALETQQARLPVSAQDVRAGLARAELSGRFQVLPGQPQVVLDVAHNPEAAAVLAENLDASGYAPTTYAVFGAMADKDVGAVMQRLAPLVQHWMLCELPTPRAARAAELAATLLRLAPGAAHSLHADPRAALQAALAAADSADRIVVFGSFYTVGGVLEGGIPKLRGPHAEPRPDQPSTR